MLICSTSLVNVSSLSGIAPELSTTNLLYIDNNLLCSKNPNPFGNAHQYDCRKNSARETRRDPLQHSCQLRSSFSIHLDYLYQLMYTHYSSVQAKCNPKGTKNKKSFKINDLGAVLKLVSRPPGGGPTHVPLGKF